MIRNFGDKDTERFAHGKPVRRFAAFERVAQRRLILLDEAEALSDLKSPGLQLELLKRERAGFYSIRINQQWRLVFHWVNGNAEDVMIEDYH